jgi:hypothetical protein
VAFDAELVDAAPPRLVRVDMAVRYPEHYADFAHLTAEGYSLVAGVWWEAMEVSE